ncbi:hypothetical protein [Pusillimonas sp. ANT_WB101]|uniref:hypothetical protein n=1 Tax=Pusillimonas sp. ANT_WB101 TaxID=2597356 RepID=UPI00165EB4C7|nr:hypothetical protein [Pusillimonas sp. ANT_WB101]
MNAEKYSKNGAHTAKTGSSASKLKAVLASERNVAEEVSAEEMESNNPDVDSWSTSF